MKRPLLLVTALLLLTSCNNSRPVAQHSTAPSNPASPASPAPTPSTPSASTPESSDTRLAEIAAIYQGGDSKTAIAKLKPYLDAHPRDDLAWTILGNASEDLDENKQAATAYTKALEINPNRVEALTGMGVLARKQGNYDQALSYYQKSLKLDPNYAQAYSSMTVIALKKRNDKQALEYAKKGYELDKTDPVIAANLAVAYHYNGQSELRDKMTQEAQRLGYKKVDTLRKIYSGEMTIRD